MANYAVIENGIVANVVEADPVFITTWMPDAVTVLLDPASPAGIGWGYDGAEFIEPPPIVDGAAATGANGGGFVSVANLVALTALDPASPGLPRGALVRTLPAIQPWFLNVTSTLAPDGITVIAAIGGGNWERSLGSGSPDALAQMNWFIDPIAGNDEATGETLGAPLKSMAELIRRWGPSGTLATEGLTPISVQILSDLPSNDPINGTLDRIGPGQILVFQANDAAILGSGTVFAPVPQNPTTNTLWTIQGNVGAFNFAPFVGNRIRINGGPNDGTTCTILDTTGGGLTAILDNPVKLPVASTGNFALTLSTISPGDAFVIVQQVRAELGQLQLTADIEESEPSFPTVVFSNLEFGGNVSQPNIPVGLILGCKFTAGLLIGNDGGVTFCLGTCFTGQASLYAGASFVMVAGCSISFSGGSAFVAFDGNAVFDADAVLYNGGLIVEGGFQEIGQLAVFNASSGILNPGAGIDLVTSNAAIQLQSSGFGYGPLRLWGAGNTAGVNVAPGALFDATTPSAKTITGVGGDIILATRATARAWDEASGAYTAPILLSWANLALAILGGGFGGNAHDVASGAAIVGP